MALAFATFYRDDQDSWEANLIEARDAADASSSTLAGDLLDTFLDGAHYPWADVERLAVEAPRRVGRREIVTVMDIANLHTANSSAAAIGDLELASWAVEERVALNHDVGIDVRWDDWYDRALIAAMGGDADNARVLLRAANQLDLSGRVGTPRSELLLVPAVVADHEDRPHDCAVLLAVIRADPFPIRDGESLAVYQSLRRRAQTALSEEELANARRAAEQLSVDSALAEFLSPSPHEA
jgi:hypothetical protein